MLARRKGLLGRAPAGLWRQMGIPSPFLQLQWWGLWPPPGTLASLPFHLAVFGLPDPVRPSVTILALSCQALLFALTLARAGRIQGESLAAWASVGPRVGSLARWHLLHKLPLARPCGSQSNPPLPAGPHPSSAEPGLLLGSCTLPEGLLPPCRFPKLTRFPERLWGGKKRVLVSVTGKQGAGRGHFLAPRPHPNIL